MTENTENGVDSTEENAGGPPPEDGGRKGRGGPLLVGVLVALGVAAAIYLLARPEPAKVPPMPRASVDESEVARTLSVLEDRARGFVPEGDEKKLVDLLVRLNRAEVGYGGEAPDSNDQARSLMEEFRRLASAVRDRDHERFVTLGEHLALRFHDALADVLGEAREKGLDNVIAHKGKEVEALIEIGGTFMRLSEHGLFGQDGVLNASPLLPEVLFRKRWCALAGARGMEGFTETELVVNHDFVAAFGDRTAVVQRLVAVERIEALDDDYDGVTARALVYHQGGQDEKAVEVLKEAVKGGREDRGTLVFLDFLEHGGEASSDR